MILETLQRVLETNGLITAFMFVGGLVWVSYWVSYWVPCWVSYWVPCWVSFWVPSWVPYWVSYWVPILGQQ